MASFFGGSTTACGAPYCRRRRRGQHPGFESLLFLCQFVTRGQKESEYSNSLAGGSEGVSSGVRRSLTPVDLQYGLQSGIGLNGPL